VIAVDLPCEDPTKRFSDYADVVVRSLDRRERVVLVAHSLGGLTAPLVAARRPVAHVVLLCALLPIPGQIPFGHDPGAPPDVAPGLTLDEFPDGTFAFTAASAATHLYNRCSPDDVKWATARLRRQSPAPNAEPCPLERWPDVLRTYVLTRDDRIVMPDHARYIARTRAGLVPIEIDGDHSPFLSNVVALARLLLSFA
jgi:pimeloyl-ACP methyl ester carboxylesterase